MPSILGNLLNPYNLQNHAQKAVPSAHNTSIVQSVTNAPSLNRIAPNPSAISVKNIVRGQFIPNIFRR